MASSHANSYNVEYLQKILAEKFDGFDNIKTENELIWFKLLIELINSFELNDTTHMYTMKIIKYRYSNRIENVLTQVFRKAFKDWRKEVDSHELAFLCNIISRESQIIKQFNGRINDILAQEVYMYIKQTIQGNYDSSFLDDISLFIKNTLIPFVNTKFFKIQDVSLFYDNILKQALIGYSFIRSEELFEIITEYPDSVPSIVELKEVMLKCGSLNIIGKMLKSTIKKRLLHIGASTNQILDVYISMIRTLKILDASDLILNFASKPVRQYLTGRTDTIRCIVSSLTEGKDILRSELKAGGSLEFCLDPDDDGDSPDPLWSPPRRTFDFPTSGVTSSGKDILAVLVSIYGSTDMFVAEYQSLLADKLMSNMTYSSDTEVALLELLKIRQVGSHLLLYYIIYFMLQVRRGVTA